MVSGKEQVESVFWNVVMTRQRQRSVGIRNERNDVAGGFMFGRIDF